MSNEKKDNYLNSILVFSFLLYAFSEIVLTTHIGNLGWYKYFVKLVNSVVFFINIVFFFRGVKSKSKWLCICIFLGLLGICVAYVNDRLFQTAILLIFIANGINVDHNDLFKKYVILAGSLLLLTILLERIGIFPHEFRIREGQRDRLYLGFRDTTFAPNYLFHIVLAYFAQKKNRISVRETLVIIPVNLLLFYWTDTKAVFFLLILLIVVLWFEKYNHFRLKSRLIKNLATVFMPVSAAVAFYLSYIYNPNNRILARLNSILTERLKIGNFALNTYPLNLFGHVIKWATGRYGIERTTDYFYVDSSYLNAALTFGIIVLIFAIICFSLLIRRSYEMGKVYLFISLMFFTTHCFSDPQLLDLKYDPFLLMIGCVFVNRAGKILGFGQCDQRVLQYILKYKVNIKGKIYCSIPVKKNSMK